MDEARDFEASNTGVDCLLNKLDFRIRREDFGFALQTVSRPDFDKGDS